MSEGPLRQAHSSPTRQVGFDYGLSPAQVIESRNMNKKSDILARERWTGVLWDSTAATGPIRQCSRPLLDRRREALVEETQRTVQGEVGFFENN